MKKFEYARFLTLALSAGRPRRCRCWPPMRPTPPTPSPMPCAFPSRPRPTRRCSACCCRPRRWCALQSPAYADLRIFNAAGQPVPMALASVPTPTSTQEHSVKLPAYPILGAEGAAAAGLEGLSLRIEERQGKRVVQLNTGGTTASTAAPQKCWVRCSMRASSRSPWPP